MTEAVFALAPQLTVALTGALILIVDLVRPSTAPKTRPGRPDLAYLGIAGLAVAAVLTTVRTQTRAVLFGGTLVIDPLTIYLDLAFLAIGIVVLLVSIDALPRFTAWPAEYYALVVWCTLGNMLVAPSADLVTLFLAFQLTSVPLIALIALGKRESRSREASLKYLVVTLVSMALLLYGMSFVYGVAGTSDMAGIGAVLADGPISALMAVGLVLMLSGFGFKITAAPFQQWAPDVYEGAPTAVVAFLSTGSKLAGFAFALRFVATALGTRADAHLAFAVLAVASMLVGNLGALQQTDIKRLLAYSGIAQAGYILLGLAAMTRTGIAAVLFYLVAYALAGLLAFTLIIALTHTLGSEQIDDYHGLGVRSPWPAFALAVAFLSLAGLPLTAGFMAKLYVFFAAAQEGLFWLVLIAVANTVMAFYYYLRVVWNLFVPDEHHAEKVVLTTRQSIAVAIGVAGIIFIGVLPGALLGVADRAAGVLFGG